MKTPSYIHSDLFAYLASFPQLMNENTNPSDISEVVFKAMLSDLEMLFDGPLIVPTYNYQFTKSRHYHVSDDPSEVGQFSELFRQKYKSKRTPAPVFSNACNQPDCLSRDLPSQVDPFDIGSDFDSLSKNAGNIVTFGSPFAPTFILYIERQIPDGPLYRFDKFFDGTVTDIDEVEHSTKLKLHVRPLDAIVRYDLNRIEKDLFDKGILTKHVLKDSFQYSLCRADAFVEYALLELQRDPLYLLTQDSRDYFDQTDAFRNGRVRLEDFE